MKNFSQQIHVCAMLLLLLLLSTPCSIQAQGTFTGDRVPMLRVYAQDQLLNIAAGKIFEGGILAGGFDIEGLDHFLGMPGNLLKI